jgi:hypothetical protein
VSDSDQFEPRPRVPDVKAHPAERGHGIRTPAGEGSGAEVPDGNAKRIRIEEIPRSVRDYGQAMP